MTVDLDKLSVLVLDFETYFDPHYSLKKLTTAEYVNGDQFKVWGLGVRFFSEQEADWLNENDVEAFLQDVDWDNTAVVCHNALFDGYILTQYYNVHPAFYYDTAAMARGIDPMQSAKLSEVCKRLWPDDEQMRKGDELVSAKGIVDLPPDIEDQIAGYCKQDVDLTHSIYNKLKSEIPRTELHIIDLTTKMFVEPKLTVDRELLTKYRDRVAEESKEKIEACGIDKKVLSSNQQFSAYLESIGINPPMKTSPTTGNKIPALGKNDAGYKQMVRKYPEHKHLWEARIAVKSRIEETRAQRFLNVINKDGSISVPLRYYAAHTGRFGGTDKLNMQNLPRGSELRKALQAPEGHLVYVADLSNIEARVLAWISNQTDLLQEFANGEDIYSNFASKIYKKPINKDDNPVERFVGKTAILGLGYGMGYKKFAFTLRNGLAGPEVDISDEDALDVVNTYRGNYPDITNFWKKCEYLITCSLQKNSEGLTYGPLTVADRALMLPNGMYLKYPGLIKRGNRYFEGSDFVYFNQKQQVKLYGGKIAENIVQALARIIITDSINKVHDYLQNTNGGSVVLTVHDEIIAVATEKDSCNIMDNIIFTMTQPPVWCKELPLSAEGGYDKAYTK